VEKRPPRPRLISLSGVERRKALLVEAFVDHHEPQDADQPLYAAFGLYQKYSSGLGKCWARHNSATTTFVLARLKVFGLENFGTRNLDVPCRLTSQLVLGA
jgi:hypothetical protein